ncbi:MAG: RNA polymerase sigma factor [Actinobacteria bacterium]|nr:RNA polymerase sigma factor [Actinomycetota bacterium]MCI0543426.1 RNA polymerase sigma factor [Actinomycetota bacterium]
MRKLRAAKNGDEAAWASIYRELAGPVTGYLASHGISEPDDVTGEVFFQIARDINRFDGDDTSFRSWVFVIAHRRMIDYHRARGRRPQPGNGAMVLEMPGGNVEEEALELLAMDWLRGLLEVLTEDQREVLALRVVADLSLEETASAMGKTVGAVKALQRRAMAALRTRLEVEGVSP